MERTQIPLLVIPLGQQEQRFEARCRFEPYWPCHFIGSFLFNSELNTMTKKMQFDDLAYDCKHRKEADFVPSLVDDHHYHEFCCNHTDHQNLLKTGQKHKIVLCMSKNCPLLKAKQHTSL